MRAVRCAWPSSGQDAGAGDSRAVSLTVRHEVIPRNSMDHVSRLRYPVSTPDAFEDSDIKLIREAVHA